MAPRHHFLSHLPTCEPDAPGTSRHFLVPTSAIEYSWSHVQVIGLQIDDAGHGHSYDSGFLQLCRDAQQVFRSQPTRLFLRGIYIFESTVELWVFDRVGMHQSQLFNQQDEPERLAAVFAWYSHMSDADLGINPLIQHDKTGPFILAENEDEDRPQLCQFYLEGDPIVSPDTIVSQSPTCYRARLSTSTKPEFVVKFSWRSEVRRSEESMLRLVKARKVRGVVNMFSHQNVETISNHRRGLQFEFAAIDGVSAKADTLGATEFTDLTLNCLVVSPLGRSLGQFRSVDEFLRGFRDPLDGYRSLHLDGNILHRDISPNNIILAEVKREGEPWGVLIDLDLGMDVAVGPARPDEIIGTKAFMAIGVLKCEPRTYRHDVESFFYVFLWIAICGGDGELPSDSRLQRWLVGGWRELAEKKAEDMEDAKFARIVCEFTPEFRGLTRLAYWLRDALFGPGRESKGAEELYSAFFSAINEELVL